MQPVALPEGGNKGRPWRQSKEIFNRFAKFATAHQIVKWKHLRSRRATITKHCLFDIPIARSLWSNKNLIARMQRKSKSIGCFGNNKGIPRGQATMQAKIRWNVKLGNSMR